MTNARFPLRRLPLLLLMLAVCSLLLSCRTPPGERSPRDELVDLLRAYGQAAVEVFGEGYAEEAPELFRLVDRDRNGVLSEEEILSIDPTSVAFATVVLRTIKRLRE